jgi:hypothetical protein
MGRRKKPDWKPAAEFTVVKLPANGPKPGQSYESWAAGKRLSDAKWEKVKAANINKLF